jgi:hypothetical protein
MQEPQEQVGSKRPALTLGLACALVAFATLAQAKVQPPPLPPGSSMVRVQGGMNDDEIKREARAHHHKGHVKKDLNRDDSEPGNSNKNDKGSKK